MLTSATSPLRSASRVCTWSTPFYHISPRCCLRKQRNEPIADDTALYRVTKEPNDYTMLQADIDVISTCLKDKSLTLNPSKCSYLFISRKRTRPPCRMLNGHQLTHVSNYKYLGVTITSDLMWSTHIIRICICTKTRNLIGLLYRSLTLCACARGLQYSFHVCVCVC